MFDFTGFRRLAAGLPLCALVLVACGGGGGGGNTPPPDTLYVRQNGDDANAGDAPDRAFRSIWHATGDAVAGQTIIVGPGEYTVPRTAAENSILIEDIDGLVLLADPEGAMTGDRAGDVVINARSSFGLRISRSSNITIEGFHIQRANGSDANTAAIDVQSASADVTIRDCVLDLNRDGIRVESSSNVTIFNNLFFDNNRAIRLNGASDVDILSNTIADNSARGIVLQRSDRTTVRNNILQDNSNRNIEADSASASSYEGDFNLIFSTGRNTDPEDTVSPSTLLGDNVVGEQALFVNPRRGDYHLGDTSPAIDAGGSLDGLLLQSLFSRSTTVDGEPDEPPVDLGYHFPEALEN